MCLAALVGLMVTMLEVHSPEEGLAVKMDKEREIGVWFAMTDRLPECATYYKV